MKIFFFVALIGLLTFTAEAKPMAETIDEAEHEVEAAQVSQKPLIKMINRLGLSCSLMIDVHALFLRVSNLFQYNYNVCAHVCSYTTLY